MFTYKYILLGLFVCFFSAASIQAQCDSGSELIKKVDTAQLRAEIYCAPDLLTVVNFWASWCSPCLKEMPHFNTLRSTFSSEELNLFMVSLDKPELLSKVEKTIKKYQIPAQVLLLLRKSADLDIIINGISPGWKGGIPYTVFIKGGRVVFAKEGMISRRKLLSLVRKHL